MVHLMNESSSLLRKKTTFYLYIICIFLISILWITTTKINCSSCSTIKSQFLHLPKTSFRDELISEHLSSYSRMYDNISSECNKTQRLSEEQQKAFPAISKLLIALREQLVSYPNEYFHGRGIVLTTGSNQLKLTEVNLKMMEFSGTRLNVQVNIIVYTRVGTGGDQSSPTEDYYIGQSGFFLSKSRS